ncbi:MAG TPA: hypothetical protein VJC00_03620 [Candidatus Nanoarchaeia archaeon]|nr:hypothetical protein [Candidatus Nanoarchaeia archaeon]
MNKKMHKKSQGWETFIKWGLIIFGTFIIIAFLFYNSIPGVVTIMEKFGLIDKEKIIERQGPPKLENVIPKTPEEKAAVQAFEAMAKSIEDCKAKSSNNCTCDLNVPMFSNVEKAEQRFTMQFFSSSDKKSFISYVFQDSLPFCTALPDKSVFANHKFENIELCTSRDFLDEGWDVGFVAEGIFNIARDSGWKLYLYEIPHCTFPKQYPVLGTKAYFDAEETANTKFKLYKLDKNHVCFIIGRDGNDYGFGSGYGDGSLNKYRQKIDSLSSC